MNKTRKIKKILVDVSKIEVIAHRFNCGRATVYNALSYKSNSELAGKIRNEALNRYGGKENDFRLPAGKSWI